MEIRRKKRIAPKNRKPEVEANCFLKKTHILIQEKEGWHGEKESNAEFVLWNFCLTKNGSPSWRPSLLLTKFTCSSLRIGRTGVSRSGPSCRTKKFGILRCTLYTLRTFFLRAIQNTLQFISWTSEIRWGLMVVLYHFMKQLKLHFSHFTAPTTWKIWQNFIANRN